MPLYDLNEFLRLSSTLNYNLSAASLNRYNILMFITNNKPLHEDSDRDKEQKAIAMEALNYLMKAYREKKRRLGPDAVIHPFRSAALLTSARENLNLLDLLTQLFHDILEDIRITDFAPRHWKEIEGDLYSLFKRTGPEMESALNQRLVYLTRLRGEQYYEYVGRLLTGASEHPELIEIKLADRLDNTLDMRLGSHDPLEGVNFFKEVFQILFMNSFKGFSPRLANQPPLSINAARRMYQLFKNAILLSLIRQGSSFQNRPAATALFDAVAHASLLEAQRIFIKIIGYQIKDVSRQRELLLDAMEYCYGGRADLVTVPHGERLLDGLFTTYFAIPSKKVRSKKIDSLYANKPLMLEAAVAFSVVFFSFINDDRFYIRGISSDGIEAERQRTSETDGAVLTGGGQP